MKQVLPDIKSILFSPIWM